jgi:hypothetical protein
MRAVIVAGMHYIQMADGTHELFNLEADAEEQANLADNIVFRPVILEVRNLLDLMRRRR